MSIVNHVIVRLMPFIPKPIVRRISARYVAGETLDDALRTVRALNAVGACATLDVLGEFITRKEEATHAADEYIAALDAIAAQKLDSNVSVKLTHLGLLLDPAFCLENVRRIVTTAARHGNFVRIDMEDSSCTAATLEIHRALRRDFQNVGVVIQAYLRRSRADVQALAAERANVRLCKGIYVEPRPIAFRDREIVRQNFVDLLGILLRGGSYVGIATHDAIVSGWLRPMRLGTSSPMTRDR